MIIVPNIKDVYEGICPFWIHFTHLGASSDGRTEKQRAPDRPPPTRPRACKVQPTKWSTPPSLPFGRAGTQKAFFASREAAPALVPMVPK